MIPKIGNTVNNMAAGHSDPEAYVRYARPDNASYHLSNSKVDGLIVNVQGQGSGHDVTVLTIDRSVTSIIRLDTPVYARTDDDDDDDGKMRFDQVWFAQVTLDPGGVGGLQQCVRASLQEEPKEDYFLIQQHALACRGTIKRYIDIASNKRPVYLRDDFFASGGVEIQESFGLRNYGPESLFDFWDPCFIPFPRCIFFGDQQVWTYDTNGQEIILPGITHAFHSARWDDPLVGNTMIAARKLSRNLSAGFLASPSQADLVALKQLYDQLVRSYNATKVELSTKQLAYVEQMINVTWTAILAMETALLAQAGSAYDPTGLAAAYDLAVSALQNNESELSPEEYSFFNTILAEVSVFINSLN